MSKLDDLIQKLCPKGVEYKTLNEVVAIRNGRDYKHLGKGNIPVYGSGGIMTYVNQFMYNKASVLLPRKGSISNVFYVDKPFWNVDTIYYTEINEQLLEPKYFYYAMKKVHIERYNTSNAARPALTQTVLGNLSIPVPPLPVQEEIVRILDSFTKLEARRRQYEYYRDKLLNYDELCPNGVEYKTLGDCCIILDRQRKPVTKSARESGTYPYYGANGIQDYVSDFIFDGTYVLVGEDGSVITKNGNPVVTWAQGKLWVNNHAHIIAEKSDVLLRYLFHFLQTVDVSSLIHGNIPKLTGGDFKSIPIPVPPLAEQERIVAILDRFDALVNDLTSGLPAEIKARRQQYEYYRDKLLSFQPLKQDA